MPESAPVGMSTFGKNVLLEDRVQINITNSDFVVISICVVAEIVVVAAIS